MEEEGEKGRRSLLLPGFAEDGPLRIQGDPPEALNCHAAALKEEANTLYNDRMYSEAIQVYNLAILQCRHPVLLSNRAAASLKRSW